MSWNKHLNSHCFIAKNRPVNCEVTYWSSFGVICFVPPPYHLIGSRSMLTMPNPPPRQSDSPALLYVDFMHCLFTSQYYSVYVQYNRCCSRTCMICLFTVGSRLLCYLSGYDCFTFLFYCGYFSVVCLSDAKQYASVSTIFRDALSVHWTSADLWPLSRAASVCCFALRFGVSGVDAKASKAKDVMLDGQGLDHPGQK